ncbi:MAG: hypothetical protein VKI83_12610 [Synechococcaceae cyanobacterium]|nr:hypothetical protein [Synechococcaceae cyanobacterium]
MIPTPAGHPASRSAASQLPPLVPVALLLLALADLRVELQLLFDHLTFTSLLGAVVSHPLAIAVLVLQPSLWSHYRRRPRAATADPS